MFQEQTVQSGQVIDLTGQHSHGRANQVQPHRPSRTSGNPVENTASFGYSQPLRSQDFSDDLFDWTESDSDYITSHSLDPETPWYTPTLPAAHSSRDSSQSRSEAIASPSDVESVRTIYSSGREVSRSVTPSLQVPSKSIPPPPFSTPPKLRTVEQVMHNYSGTDLAALRKLTTALAREAIFGREALAKRSLSGRSKDSEQLDPQKLDYIKTLVHSRVPNKSDVDFEETWKLCRSSLSKSCQTLRNSVKKKIL